MTAAHLLAVPGPQLGFPVKGEGGIQSHNSWSACGLEKEVQQVLGYYWECARSNQPVECVSRPTAQVCRPHACDALTHPRCGWHACAVEDSFAALSWHAGWPGALLQAPRLQPTAALAPAGGRAPPPLSPQGARRTAGSWLLLSGCRL